MSRKRRRRQRSRRGWAIGVILALAAIVVALFMLASGDVSPENREAAAKHAEQGLLKAQDGRFEEAIIDFTLAIELNAYDAGVWTNRGNAYTVIGKESAAIRDYTRAIRLDPALAGAFVNRALVYRALGRPGDAREDLAEALSLSRETGDKGLARKIELLLAPPQNFDIFLPAPE